ncbi:MAG: hypothetical protein ABIF82_11810, partial [Planctomycetota bacterium]
VSCYSPPGVAPAAPHRVRGVLLVVVLFLVILVLDALLCRSTLSDPKEASRRTVPDDEDAEERFTPLLGNSPCRAC